MVFKDARLQKCGNAYATIKTMQAPRSSGFTIVELLIIIVVIGILAAITIVGYNGIQSRAISTVVQNDVKSSAKQLEAYKVGTSSSEVYPTTNDCTATPAANSICLKPSGTTTLQYTYMAGTNSYCLSAVNGSVAYNFSSLTNATTPGVCTGHSGPVGGPIADNGGVVSSMAGSVYGFADGMNTAASFRYPWGVTADTNGDVYVADSANHRIRKVTPAGLVSTVAGNGTAALVNGTGTNAQFNEPEGLVLDGQGNLYVADASNQAIRKIVLSTGLVSTFAGGTVGSADGMGTAAQFNRPSSITMDSSGNFFVTDTNNQRIRKITPAGEVTIFAGSTTSATGTTDGTGTAARFGTPRNIAIGPDGSLFVADMGNNRIRKITPAGVVSTYAGTTSGYVDGAGTTVAKFNWPAGVTVDPNGNVFVADVENNRIRKITPDRVVSTFAGTGTGAFADGTGITAAVKRPRGIYAAADGKIYIADTDNNRIRRML